MSQQNAPILFTGPDDLRQYISREKRMGKRIGLVPTMGALHEGHLSLVRASCEACDITVVSIFVNPTQFAPNEDFAKYPRTLASDLELLHSCNGTIVVFAPSVETMYPSCFNTFVEVGGITERLEGEYRPTHFRGVATIVLKLFLLVQQDVAFFGQKDFQQCAVIKKMVSDLNVPTQITVCPIIREPDGLAMSSRNKYLSQEERKQAVVLSESLLLAQKMFSHGEKDTDTVCRKVREHILTARDAKIDYAAIVDPETFEDCTELASGVVILLAVRIGATRLIDNIILNYSHSLIFCHKKCP
ncbi:MAG: pantoate--beta-alanine ligase [Planctomycetaceae bacterium]|jgi:pantoate--beta-alanine ligase|nr:pantoate--beta-alanine ligase [Planctomycetaceae bacterium]